MRESVKKSIIYAVTNLDPEVCLRIREARRLAGISQSALAREVGCGQPALSMFEQGDGTKLNDDVIKTLCGKFGVEINPKAERAVAAGVEEARLSPVVVASASGYCPNPACPSHREYFVEGVRRLEPDRAKEDPVGGKFCAVCGEVLERRCPSCGAAVHAGAICSHCGKPYVAI